MWLIVSIAVRVQDGGARDSPVILEAGRRTSIPHVMSREYQLSEPEGDKGFVMELSRLEIREALAKAGAALPGLLEQVTAEATDKVAELIREWQ